MDDDLASPEEQKAIQKRLQGIAWDVIKRLNESQQGQMDAVKSSNTQRS